MEISVTWYDANERILIETFPEKWDVNDYYRMVDVAREMVMGKDYDVDIVADFTSSKSFPTKLAAGARYAETKLPPNQGRVVFVKPGKMVELYISIFQNLNSKSTSNLVVDETVAEAVAHIQALRSKA